MVVREQEPRVAAVQLELGRRSLIDAAILCAETGRRNQKRNKQEREKKLP
jgi:hypothetical protein